MYSKKTRTHLVENDHGKRIRSDHIVPVEITEILKSNEDSVSIGCSKFVRVIAIGRLTNKSIDEELNLLKLEITDAESDNRICIEKLFSTTFKRETYEELNLGNFVNVAGKIRLNDRGTPYLNAFSIRKCSQEEHRAFKTEAKLCQKYYKSGKVAFTPRGPDMEKRVTKELNLGRMGLTRFPLGMLEHSSVTNNGNVWPKDLPINLPGFDDQTKLESVTSPRRNSKSPDTDDSFDIVPGTNIVENVPPVDEEQKQDSDSFDNY